MTKKKFAVQAVAFVLAWCALPFLLACGTGCEEHQGVCACEQKPIGSSAAEEAKPSDEKPRRSQQPEWQTGEVKADTPQSQAGADANLDTAKAKADAEGKKAAGLN